VARDAEVFEQNVYKHFQTKDELVTDRDGAPGRLAGRHRQLSESAVRP
jgi:hypothetical protein